MRKARWLTVLALPLALAAQPKKLVNAQVDTRPAGDALEQVVRTLEAAQPQPAWIAWSEPSARTRQFGCDSYWRDGETTVAGGTVHLEPAAEVMVMLRIEGNHIDRVRSLAPDCDIDAGGVPLHWLTGVKPAESVALLSRLAATERLGDSALHAIALHADAAADRALESFAAADQPEWLRRNAVRSLAGWRGRRGFEAVRRIIASAETDRLREQAVQALAQSREPEALDLLISLARKDSSAGVRKQAMNALARTRDPRAVRFFEEVLAVKP